MKKLGYIKGQRVDFKDGFIVVPPVPIIMNLAEPDVYAESEDPLYPIGTLAWFPGIGKKFRYSKAGTALAGIKTLAANGNYAPTDGGQPDVNGFYGNVALAHDAGVKEITFTDTIDRVQDYYEGAHLLIFDAARAVCYEDSYIVSGPPAATTTPWSTTVKLLKAKKYAIVANDGIEIWLNPYSNIQQAADGFAGHATFMGVPPRKITNGYYFWLQTAGPVFITPAGWTNVPGYDRENRVAVVSGSSNIIEEATTTDRQGLQRVGCILSRTSDGYGDAWVNLDMDLGH